jgi:hypothetical protein
VWRWKRACLPGAPPERTLRGTGANLLQGSTPRMLTTAHGVDLSARVRFPGVVHGTVDDAHVDPEGIVSADRRAFVRVAGRGEHPLTAHEHQIDLTLRIGQQFTVGVGTGERDALPTSKPPDRYDILAPDKAEDAFVVGLGGVRVGKESLVFLSPAFRLSATLAMHRTVA